MLIKNGIVIDPIRQLHRAYDLRIDNGVITAIAEKLNKQAGEDVVDASNCYIMPGLFDMHVHLREPGYEYKEDIASGTAAAARGGVTGLLAMPNTKPTVDTADIVADIKQRIAERALVNVELTGSISRGLASEALSDIAAMAEAGIVAITDDGRTTMALDLVAEAYQIIKPLDIPLILHAEDHAAVGRGVIHAGEVSRQLGVDGIAPEVESAIVERDIAIAKTYGAKLHIAHISTEQSIAAVRQAKREGLPVTAEACPHHFILTDDIVLSAGNLAKVNPPIRSERHRAAVEIGLLDGTIDCIVTDHAPHTLAEKAADIYAAPFGISGVELSLSLSYTHIVKSAKMSIDRLVELMAIAPRQLLGLAVPTIDVGRPADLAIFNYRRQRVIRADDMVSRGKNIPYEGMVVTGDVVMTLCAGRVVYKEN